MKNYYYIQTKIGGNPINLFAKDMQVGETWNGYKAIVFKAIADLFIVSDNKPFLFGIEIHSNVYKIRTSNARTEWSFLGTKTQK